MKHEADLKSALTRELKRQLPGFLVLHYATNGAPDREVVGGGISSRWECKHATPDFRSPGDQELMCMRLAEVGHCRYIIWCESWSGLNPRTLIVHPRQVHERTSWDLQPEAWCLGHDMVWLVNQIRAVHQIHTVNSL